MSGEAERGWTIFVVDDHEIVRRGLVDLLQSRAGLHVVGQAGTAAGAVAGILEAAPDVVLLDVRLPDGNGVEVCREVRSVLPDTSVLMLTSYSDARAEMDAMLAGASGYFLKDIRSADLLEAVEAVAEGRKLMDSGEIARRLSGELGADADPGWDSLSPQEKRVLLLIGEGLTNRQIAEQMYLSEKTVKHYVSSVLLKLNMQRRSQAAVYVTRLEDEGRTSG